MIKKQKIVPIMKKIKQSLNLAQRNKLHMSHAVQILYYNPNKSQHSLHSWECIELSPINSTHS
jgi:hypothetical protein